MQVHPSLASGALYRSVASAVASEPPRSAFDPEQAESELANCLLAHFLHGRGMDEAVGEAHAASAAILRCVNNGIVDFNKLENEQDRRFIPAAACLPKAAIDVLQSCPGGIVNFALPYCAGEVDGYDPAALAENLNDSAPHLAHLTLPAPRNPRVQWPAITTLDLRGLRLSPPPSIHILRESTSVLGIVLDTTAGAPSCASTPPASGDPLAMAPSVCVWMDGDKVVCKDKLANAYYHHTNSKSSDPEMDRERQAQAAKTMNNGKAAAEGIGLVVCGDFVMHVLHQTIAEVIARDLGVLRTPFEERHPVLEGLGSIEGISKTVGPISRERHNDFFVPGQWTPCHAPSLGKTLSRLMRENNPGDERFFCLWAPGSGNEVESHGMFVRVRVKTKPDLPCHVRDEKDPRRFAARGYDPQLTGTWARGFADSLEELGEFSPELFIRGEWLNHYMRAEAPICAIREWPAVHPQASQADEDVPPEMRATPEYLWAASLGGPEMLASALDRVLALPRAEFPLQNLNAVFGGRHRSILGWLVTRGDCATASAYVDTIANTGKLLPQERHQVAVNIVAAVLPCGSCELVSEILRPLIGIVGVAPFVSAARRCGRPDAQVKAIFQNTITLTYAAERRSLHDDEPSLAVADAISATFPQGDPRIDQWAREFGVMGKGPSMEQVAELLDPLLVHARKPTLADPAPADIIGALAEESAADRCEWELACLRHDILARGLSPETEARQLKMLATLARKIERYKETGDVREDGEGSSPDGEASPVADSSRGWFLGSWERRAQEIHQLLEAEAAEHAWQLRESPTQFDDD
jgi:hypothetical protein